jgi:membrane protease YdiL (CAAX protease family)
VVGWIYEGDLWVRLACFGLAAGFAPLFEELFFRGALQRYFRGRLQFLASALLTGLIFAALHPQGVFAIPALAGIGVGFSLLREWRDSLIAPMTAHAINNGCLVGMLWWML